MHVVNRRLFCPRGMQILGLHWTRNSFTHRKENNQDNRTEWRGECSDSMKGSDGRIRE
eukprot:m.32971 g.32971  ORF g.32971 m.32971 type:complete len:58 (+) comp7133_c0_seq1:701-874(+)